MQESHALRRWEGRDILPDIGCVSALVAYFLHFALQSLPAHFRADDLRNMVIDWSRGWWETISNNLCFWRGAGRPLGGLFYLSLHSWFDLEPRPYRIIAITLLAAAIPFAYTLGRALTRSRSVAFLAVFAWCYHPRLANLVFVTAFIFDVLCSLFYFAALACYVAVRERERSLGRWQLGGCFALYICALNSKEMAVTLPVIVLVYEVLKYYHTGQRESLLRWMRRYATPALVAGVIAAIYVYQKTYGPGGVVTQAQGMEMYVPHYTWQAFSTSNSNFVSQFYFLFSRPRSSVAVLLCSWAAVFLYAFLRRDRTLQLMAFWVVITPLPLAFIAPRTGGPLVIVLFGWTMVLAKIVADLSLLLAKRALLGKVPIRAVRVALTLIVAIGLGVYIERHNSPLVSFWLRIGEKEARLIAAFRTLGLQPKPGSRILLVNNPFTAEPFGTRIAPRNIALLLWNDHSLSVYLEGSDTLSSDEIANMDYVLALDEDKLDVVRALR
jgi:hypothetical protein